MSEQQPKMFDSKFVIAILMIGFAWMGWQSYLAKKYPPAKKTDTVVQGEAQTNGEAPANGEAQTAAATDGNGMAKKSGASGQGIMKSAELATEKLTSFEDAELTLNVSSIGMSLKNIRLREYTDRKGDTISFADGAGLALFETRLLGNSQPLVFDVQKVGDKQITGVAEVKSLGLKITKNIIIDSSKFTFDTTVKVEGESPSFLGLDTESIEKVDAGSSSGSFFSSFGKSRFEHQEFYVNHEGSTSRLTADSSKSAKEDYSKTLVAAFGSQYFGSAIVDNSDVMPEFRATTTGTKAIGDLQYKRLNNANTFEIKYTSFAGPKSFELLKTISPEMTGLVNFGFFTLIAKGIFWLMKVIQSAVGNWGLSIICLTFLIRLVVLPVNMLSYKQMKTMTKIQPQMKSLRERYKNDTQKLNQEMLALMKEHKANPIGGCLPMLLQIPIFFALYQVIGQSIELYKAPFAFWIQDLSAKDPYYVLPVLMGITMFVQQKITPNNMDPQQQKVMMFMPLMFCFFFFSLPSGLTLYMFVSSVFGIAQQIYFTKDRNVSVADELTATAH